MTPTKILDTKLTRPDRGRRFANGVAFIGGALIMLFYGWLWDSIQDFIQPVVGPAWSIKIVTAGFLISVFGLGYGLAPFGDKHEAEDWDETETTTP